MSENSETEFTVEERREIEANRPENRQITAIQMVGKDVNYVAYMISTAIIVYIIMTAITILFPSSEARAIEGLSIEVRTLRQTIAEIDRNK